MFVLPQQYPYRVNMRNKNYNYYKNAQEKKIIIIINLIKLGLMHITLPSRAQHDTLSKKGIVIFEDNDATGLDNQVIDRSG